jgi:hypothetical protein
MGSMMVEENGLPGGVGLAEAIKALRAELTEAMLSAPGQGMRFRPGPVELTVEAALTKGVGGRTGIKWWLFEAGGEASRQSVVTQTLSLTLEPVLVNDRGEVVDALISGEDDAPSEESGGEDRPTVGTE